MQMERWRPGRGLIPWIPLGDLEQIQRRFGDVLSRPLLPAIWRRIPTMEMGWAPAMYAFEKDDKLTVKAESDVREDDYYYRERSYGSFSHSLAVPSNIDTKRIEASYEDGVLEISLPKMPAVKPKKISVSAKKETKANRLPMGAVCSRFPTLNHHTARD